MFEKKRKAFLFYSNDFFVPKQKIAHNNPVAVRFLLEWRVGWQKDNRKGDKSCMFYNAQISR